MPAQVKSHIGASGRRDSGVRVPCARVHRIGVCRRPAHRLDAGAAARGSRARLLRPVAQCSQPSRNTQEASTARRCRSPTAARRCAAERFSTASYRLIASGARGRRVHETQHEPRSAVCRLEAQGGRLLAVDAARLKTEWTLIFNSDGHAFHTQRNPRQDVGKITLQKQTLPSPVEQLTFTYRSGLPSPGGVLSMSVGKRRECSHRFPLSDNKRSTQARQSSHRRRLFLWTERSLRYVSCACSQHGDQLHHILWQRCLERQRASRPGMIYRHARRMQRLSREIDRTQFRRPETYRRSPTSVWPRSRAWMRI